MLIIIFFNYLIFRNGYLTTKKEKEMKDKLQQKNEEAMSRYMKTLIGTKQK